MIAPLDTVQETHHPFVLHALRILRTASTSDKVFRRTMNTVAPLMVFEAMTLLDITSETIETPVPDASGNAMTMVPSLGTTDFTIVEILGAGNALNQAIEMFDMEGLRIEHGFIALRRDPVTHKPEFEYCRLRETITTKYTIVFEPMIATGGSACDSIDRLKQRGSKNIIFVSLMGAKLGVEKVQAEHPDVHLYIAKVVLDLDENDYIVFGPADAGDRFFGC